MVMQAEKGNFMNANELAENDDWLARNGGPELPVGLQDGGLWLMVIRAEIDDALRSAAYVQVRKPPPAFLRWLLRPWLRFPSQCRLVERG